MTEGWTEESSEGVREGRGGEGGREEGRKGGMGGGREGRRGGREVGGREGGRGGREGGRDGGMGREGRGRDGGKIDLLELYIVRWEKFTYTKVGQPPARGPDPAHEGLASGPPPFSAITLQSGPRNPSQTNAGFMSEITSRECTNLVC